MHPRRGSGNLLEQVELLFAAGTAIGLTDRDLLERFLSGERESGESAFTALVERHGPMVLRVCNQALRDRHAAEDAFQATFLVLARLAGSIRRRDSVESWLFGVASRAAAQIRMMEARRQRYSTRAQSTDFVARQASPTGQSHGPNCMPKSRDSRKSIACPSCFVILKASRMNKPPVVSGGRSGLSKPGWREPVSGFGCVWNLTGGTPLC